MRTQALCKSSSFKKRLSLAVMVASGVLACSVAQAGGFSAYGGATVGLSPSAQACPTGADCERVAAGAKMFAGWNMTPNVAAEINYFYFGATASNSENPTASTVNKRVSAKALALGFSWNIEMFETMASHLRAGVARVRNVSDIQTTTSGSPVSQVYSQDVKYTTSPYFGAGFSIPFGRHLRVVTGYDFIYVGGDGNRSRHLLSGGFQGEF
ncbi:MAG: hypothetical protein EOP38_18740 [Rubrivivax sp.]|nr:MAG: hypothetical protein EOP38_18740 [Rubrivivax sp.]